MNGARALESYQNKLKDHVENQQSNRNCTPPSLLMTTKRNNQGNCSRHGETDTDSTEDGTPVA
jgi:hypothetical protein